MCYCTERSWNIAAMETFTKTHKILRKWKNGAVLLWQLFHLQTYLLGLVLERLIVIKCNKNISQPRNPLHSVVLSSWCSKP